MNPWPSTSQADALSSELIPNIISQGREIRTLGLLAPNETRYQAALHPVSKFIIILVTVLFDFKIPWSNLYFTVWTFYPIHI